MGGGIRSLGWSKRDNGPAPKIGQTNRTEREVCAESDKTGAAYLLGSLEGPRGRELPAKARRCRQRRRFISRVRSEIDLSALSGGVGRAWCLEFSLGRSLMRTASVGPWGKAFPAEDASRVQPKIENIGGESPWLGVGPGGGPNELGRVRCVDILGLHRGGDAGVDRWLDRLVLRLLQ